MAQRARIDTFRDFDRIRKGELLLPKGNGFEWRRTNDRIVGKMVSYQEAMPCVFISVWALRDGKPVYAYTSSTRYTTDTDIYWESDGRYVHASFSDDLEDDGEHCRQAIDKIPPLDEARDSLLVNDDAGVFASEYRVADRAPAKEPCRCPKCRTAA